jgi:hypothetical protein
LKNYILFNKKNSDDVKIKSFKILRIKIGKLAEEPSNHLFYYVFSLPTFFLKLAVCQQNWQTEK